MSVLIVTEYGEGIGLGHLNRCKAISNAIYALDSECELIALDGIESSKRFYGTEFKNEKKFDTLLLDSYIITASEIERLKKGFKKCAAIDDFDRISYPVDIIFNPSIKPLLYKNQSARVLGGAEFVIVRSDFLEFDKTQKRGEKITITLGGDDKSLLSLDITQELLDSTDDDINLIFGKEMDREIEMGDRVRTYGHLSANEMARLFWDSKAVISGCGQTLNELAFLEIPTIGILMAKNQENNAKNYAEVGFLSGAIDTKDGFEKKVANTLNSGLKTPPRKLLDGDGAKNIAKELV